MPGMHDVSGIFGITVKQHFRYASENLNPRYADLQIWYANGFHGVRRFNGFHKEI